MKFNSFEVKNSSILYLYAQRKSIFIDPDYQRMGEVWTLDKKQLLIDSILNDFDVPKIYFHDLRDDKKSKHEFAIIDGRQRLEAVWSFIDGDFSLSKDFEYLKDAEVEAANMTYEELATHYPHIKQLFDASSLSVIAIQVDDLDLIEEMFSRLNEAVPLNAAEKRNAFGGPLPKLARAIAAKAFFSKNLKISNRRYQHRDLAAKMLYLTHTNDVVDTKKVYLDAFFKSNKAKREMAFKATTARVTNVLNEMQTAFTAHDKLLRSAGMVVLYYLLFDLAIQQKWRKSITRAKLQEFENARIKNRAIAERDITKANYDLLEFDRLTQTPNDAYAIKFRLGLLKKFVHPRPRRS